MRAPERDRFTAVRAAVEPFLPALSETHPLGRDPGRVSNEVGLGTILIRPGSGCASARRQHS